VVNLAAQAGVRYSFINPEKYIDVNIKGFFNIIELSKKFKVDLFLFASSSSVYGDNKSNKLTERDNSIKPISLYGATKLSNEIIAYTYSKLFRLNSVGLRFFTVYGPWGRPDMSLNQFVKNIISNKKINLFNGGDHVRDFTYIDDIIFGIVKIIKNKFKNKKSKIPYQILNISSSRPVKLKYYLKTIEKKLSKKSKIKLLPLQKGDIRKTHGDTSEIKKIGYKPKISIEKGISNFIDWYKSYYN
jgi:UDP-glucuronate 4-epimerase